MIDHSLVTRKTSLILEDLTALTPLAQLPPEQYLADSVNETLAERYLNGPSGE